MSPRPATRVETTFVPPRPNPTPPAAVRQSSRAAKAPRRRRSRGTRRALLRRHDLAQRRPLEHQRRRVVGRIARRQLPLGDQPRVQRPPLLLAVVVRAAAARQQTRARPAAPPAASGRTSRSSSPRTSSSSPRSRRTARRPASHASRSTTSSPCMRHTASSEAVLPPPTQMTSCASTNAAQVRDGALEQPEVGRLAVVVAGERAVEVRDVVGRVAARGRRRSRPAAARSAPATARTRSAAGRSPPGGATPRPSRRSRHAPVNTASGSSALTIHSPASTISEIFRSTHSEHSR